MCSKEEPRLTKEQEKEKEKEMAEYFEQYEREHRSETLSQIHQRVCIIREFHRRLQNKRN